MLYFSINELAPLIYVAPPHPPFPFDTHYEKSLKPLDISLPPLLSPMCAPFNLIVLPSSSCFYKTTVFFYFSSAGGSKPVRLYF